MSTQNKQTLKEAGYEYVRFSPHFQAHILKDTATGTLELWVARKNHASYGLIYKNTHLEYVSEYVPFYGVHKSTLYNMFVK